MNYRNNKLFSFDKKKSSDCDYLIGTDEAGRGPGAGPVFAAAVYFPKPDKNLVLLLNEINDSKQISENKREELYKLICENSIYHIASSSVEEIEKLNILRASLLAMKRACSEVTSRVSENENIKILIDGNKLIPDFNYKQEFIIKGDSKSASIAAASILAKVKRDNFMKNLHNEFPDYLWDKNKGYLTKEHLDAIDKFGLTKWHRKKFLEKHFENSKQMQLSFTIEN
jgi:ribonuclease HII